MSKTHTVKAGDTLSEIAQKYGLSVKDLVKWNDIENPHDIKVGQQIRLSDGGAANSDGEQYTVKSGDTFSEIGQKFGVAYKVIMDVNGYEDPTKLLAGSTITIPYRTHDVKSGDTFSAIGQKYDVPFKKIMKMNGYDDPTKLPVGVTLNIPFS